MVTKKKTTKKTVKKTRSKIVSKLVSSLPSEPVSKEITSKDSQKTGFDGSRKLIIDLGGTLKKGARLSNDQYDQLINAGFTNERLFGN